jgi:hypothetical protein
VDPMVLFPRHGGLRQRKNVSGGLAASTSMNLSLGRIGKPGNLLQTKLLISQPGDRYEQEADRIADQVMRMPESDLPPQVAQEKSDGESIQAKPRANRTIPSVQERVDPEEQTVQTKQAGERSSQADANVEAQARSFMGGGQPLPVPARNYFEPRFGHDFRNVRIHTGPTAAESAQALNARAFTLGSDIAFGEGEYTAGSWESQRLLAHELTHVVQPENNSIRLAEDEERYFPTMTAMSAVTHACSLMGENIWFDSWGNDLRDNDNDGKVDDSSEKGLYDGIHYHHGTVTYKAKVCPIKFLRTDQCPGWMQKNIDVYYKVCIDVPKESYSAAGISMPSTRRIRDIIPWFRRSSSFQTWTKPTLPTIMVPGDFIAVQSGGHSHSGIAATFGAPTPWLVDAIHLPGPTSRRSLGGQLTYWPSSDNDVFRTPWPFDIDFVARPLV